MIDIKHLINYLPYYYKESDTYKDSDGKGILEKFLEIGGTYLQENIKNTIDSTLDKCLSVDKNIPDNYLNYIWESFGKFPFAKPDSQSVLELSREQKINLIRYTISLYKIRGSFKFYEILFRLYSNDKNLLELKSIEDLPSDYLIDFRDKLPSRKDIDKQDLWPYFDMSSFDSRYYFDEFREVSLNGKVIFKVNINPLISTDMKNVWNILKKLIDTYLPFHAVSTLYLNGKNHEDVDYSFQVSIKVGNRWIPQVNGTEVDLQSGEDILVKVRLVDSQGKFVKDIPWYSDMLYTKGKNVNNDPNYTQGKSEPYVYYGEQIFNISSIYRMSDSYNITEVKNTYRFYLKDPDDSFEFTVNNSRYKGVTTYVIFAHPHPKSLDGQNPIELSIEAYKLVDGVKYPCTVFSENFNTSKDSKESNNYITKWKVNKAGKFGFYITENPNYRVEVKIKDYIPAYRVLLGYKYSYIKDPLRPSQGSKYTQVDKSNEKVARVNIATVPWYLKEVAVKVNIVPIGPGRLPKDIKVNILGSSIYLNDGEWWTPFSFSTFTFVPTMGDTSRNESAVLELSDNNIDFNLVVDYQDEYGDILKNTLTGDPDQVGVTIKYQPLNSYTESLINDALLSWKVECPDGTTHVIGYGHSDLPGEQLEFINDKYHLFARDIPLFEERCLRINSKIPGIFKVTSSVKSLRLGSVNKITYIVKDGRVTSVTPHKLVIVPINTWTNNWIEDKPTDKAVYRIGNGKPYPIFKIVLIDKQNSTISDNNLSLNQVPYPDDPTDLVENVYGEITVHRDTTFKASYKDVTLVASIKLIKLEAEPTVLSWVGNKDGIIIGDNTKNIDIKADDTVQWILEKSQE